MTLVFFTFFLFAAGIFTNKQILDYWPPTFFVGFRMFVAGSMLLIYNLHKRQSWKFLKEDWPWLLVITCTTTLFPAIFKSYGLAHLSAGHVAILGSIDPFITAIYSYFIWSEKLTWKKALGITLGMIGAIVPINMSCITMQSLCNVIPQLAVLSSVTLSRLGWILVSILLRRDRYTPTQLNSIMMLSSGILALITSWSFETGSLSVASKISIWHFAGLLVFTIIIGNIFAYNLYAYILKHTNATLVSLAGVSIPFFVRTFEWIFKGIPLDFNFLIAIILLFIGLFFFYYDDLKKKHMQQSVQ